MISAETQGEMPVMKRFLHFFRQQQGCSHNFVDIFEFEIADLLQLPGMDSYISQIPDMVAQSHQFLHHSGNTDS